MGPEAKLYQNVKQNFKQFSLIRIENISLQPATAASERAPGTGQSDSQVVNQVELSSQSQASSSKRQASSKPEPVQVQASSAKRQASQPE